jgi:hypothetical protein
MLDNLDSSTIAVVICAILIFLFILYQVIKEATKSRFLIKMQRMNIELLSEIAKKLGVEDEKVNEIINKHNQ